jgi:hypothetical protein
MVRTTEEKIPLHSRESAAVTLTEKGHRGVEVGAKVLAAAGIEILAKPELLAEIKEAF